MRDSIILSGWRWDNNNVPERMARALAHAGSRVLYCESAVSYFRRSPRPFTEIQKNLFAFGLQFLGQRFHSSSFLSHVQTVLMINQIAGRAKELKLRDPLFIYPHGIHLPICKEFKRRGFPLVHVSMDYELPAFTEDIREADLTLAITRAVFDELKPELGDKIRLIPQFSSYEIADLGGRRRLPEHSDLASIPKPRLGYFGELTDRTSIPLLSQFLTRHQEWQFISFGNKKWLPLANEHVLAWRSTKDLDVILDALDVGFMPYDCSIPKNFHCVPLKLFDYFARGMPVVSTPIAYLQEHKDLVYVGETADELSEAVLMALNEPADSPKKAKRIEIARDHSVENLSAVLASILNNVD